MERRRLLTENDLIEAPATLCPKCAGMRRINGILCKVCLGEGRIVVERRAPVSLTVMDFLWIIPLAAVVAGAVVYFWG